MGLTAEDFPYGKLPADMSASELIAGMREIMSQAHTWSFNSDIASALWEEINSRMTSGRMIGEQW